MAYDTPEKAAAYKRLRQKQFVAAGLTTKGKPRINKAPRPAKKATDDEMDRRAAEWLSK